MMINDLKNTFNSRPSSTNDLPRVCDTSIALRVFYALWYLTGILVRINIYYILVMVVLVAKWPLKKLGGHSSDPALAGQPPLKQSLGDKISIIKEVARPLKKLH